MLHRRKFQTKAVSVDILEYQGTPDTMVHLAETAEMDSEGTKEIEVSQTPLWKVTLWPHVRLYLL